MQIMEIRSTSEKEALKEVAELLKISDKEITAKLLKKGVGGFLGMGSKEPSTYVVSAIEQKTPIDAVIKASVMQVSSKMGYDVTVDKIEPREDEKTYVLLNSDSAGHIIGKRGKTLEALQFVVNLIVQQFSGVPPKILLDIENYRERRSKYLIEMASRMAETVIKHGKSRLLDPLNPYERRLVHMTLQEDDRVYTESEGVGVYKRVRIKLNNKKSESAQKQDSRPGRQSKEKFKDENDLDHSILTGGDDESPEDPIPEDFDLESSENQFQEQ